MSGTQLGFIHSHVHTIYSVNDSVIKIPALLQTVKENGMNGVIVTDHGSIRCLPELIEQSKKSGVSFRVGCESYFTPNDRLVKEDNGTNHLVLIPRTQEGFHNFMRIMSDAGLNKMNVRKSSKYYERTDFSMLKKYGKGIIGSSACLFGYIPTLLLADKLCEARTALMMFKEYLDDFYLELQTSEDKDQLILNTLLLDLAKETGTKCIITSDCHYVRKRDKLYHDILLLAAKRSPYTIDTNYIMSEKQVTAYCDKYKISRNVIKNTSLLYNSIEEIQYVPKNKNFFLPSFPVPEGYTEDTYLIKETKKGLINKFEEQGITSQKKQQKYLKQADFELSQNITPKGFSGYFLILADLIREGRKRGILFGPGRGSAAGSIVSYANNITSIDPIKNSFVFERFLSRQRDEFPDIDTDVSKLRRSEMIEYIAKKYNSNNGAEINPERFNLPTGIRVVQLENFTYIGVKNGLKGIMRAYDSINGTDTFQEVNALTKSLASQVEQQALTPELFEEILFNDKDKWLDTLGDNKWKDVEQQYQRLQDFYGKYPFAKDGMDGIRGCITGIGLHAGAVIISGVDLESNVPLARAMGSSVLPVVTFNMHGATLFNLLKVDLLGLRTLSAFEKFMDITGLDLDWYDSEDLDDSKVYDTINKHLTTDGFQLCTNSAKRLLKTFKINRFEDITAFLAGNRPGPLAKDKTTGKSMMDLYIAAKEGGNENHIHPDVDKILSDTYGTLWYQEHLLKIAQVVAGYDLGSADSRIRKVLGKKLIDKIPEIKNEFIYGKKSIFSEVDTNNPQDKPKVIGVSKENSTYCPGAINKGYSEKTMLKLFENMSEFAKYSFNKAHSGAYAKIAYKTMWAKTYYPVEWSLACLITHDNDDLVKETLAECKRLDIPILGPDINKSDRFFSMEISDDGVKQLRFGLLNIKGVGENAVTIIQYIRKTRGDFTSPEDFYTKIKSIKKQELQEKLNLKSNSANKTVFEALILSGSFDSFEDNRYTLYNRFMIDIYLKQSKSKTTITPYPPSTFTTKSKINLEKQFVGMYISEHILDNFPYQSFGESVTGETIETSGIILSGEIRQTKKKEDFGKFTIEDKFGDIFNVMLFGKKFKELAGKVFDDEDRVIQGKVVIVTGEVNKQFNNINCQKLSGVKRKKKQKPNAEEFIPTVDNIEE